MSDASAIVTYSGPLSRPLHFLVLELVVLASTALVFAHALGHWRRGDRRHMFQWLVITAYGVEMELIAFHFLHNYEHGQFSVQLFGDKLPLYVTGLYGSFLYTGIKLVERLELGRWAEALLAGFAICLIDVPFDLAGVAVGWWKWLDTDPNLAYRWLGVPVTSYYWYLVFGAAAVLECKVLWARLERRSFGWSIAIAPLAGFGVIFFGAIGFLPFHLVKALGVSDGTIVAVHLVGCAALALATTGKKRKASGLVLAVVAILPGWITAFLVWEALQGRLSDAHARVAWSAAALAGLAVISRVLPLRARASTPVAEGTATATTR